MVLFSRLVLQGASNLVLLCGRGRDPGDRNGERGALGGGGQKGLRELEERGSNGQLGRDRGDSDSMATASSRRRVMTSQPSSAPQLLPLPPQPQGAAPVITPSAGRKSSTFYFNYCLLMISAACYGSPWISTLYTQVCSAFPQLLRTSSLTRPKALRGSSCRDKDERLPYALLLLPPSAPAGRKSASKAGTAASSVCPAGVSRRAQQSRAEQIRAG